MVFSIYRKGIGQRWHGAVIRPNTSISKTYRPVQPQRRHTGPELDHTGARPWPQLLRLGDGLHHRLRRLVDLVQQICRCGEKIEMKGLTGVFLL